MSLNSTLCHPQAESYVSVAEADEFFAKHPEGTIWAAAETETKEAVLRQTSLVLDSSLLFTGENSKLIWAGLVTRIFSSLSSLLSGGFIDNFEQRFRLPDDMHPVESGTIASVSGTSIVITALADKTKYVSDFLNHGSLRFADGDEQYNIYRITDFDVATGMITLEEAPTGAAVGDNVNVIYPLPFKKRMALYEMALEVAKGNWDQSVNASVIAAGNPSQINLLPAKVLTYLGYQNCGSLRVRRV